MTLTLNVSGAASAFLALSPASANGIQAWHILGGTDAAGIANQLEGGAAGAMAGAPVESASYTTFTGLASWLKMGVAASSTCTLIALMQAGATPAGNSTSAVGVSDSTLTGTALTSPSVAVTSATLLTVTATHSLIPGAPVTLAGWSGTGINGTYNVASVNGTTSFTVATTGASGTPTGGTVTPAISGQHIAMAYSSGVVLRGTRVVNSSGTPTVVNATLSLASPTAWNLVALVCAAGVGWTLYNLTAGTSITVSNTNALVASGTNLMAGSGFTTYSGASNIAFAGVHNAALTSTELAAIRTQLLAIMAGLTTPITGF
jgi:hypothetical protein